MPDVEFMLTVVRALNAMQRVLGGLNRLPPLGEPFLGPYVQAFRSVAADYRLDDSGVEVMEQFVAVWDERSRSFMSAEISGLEFTLDEREKMRAQLAEFNEWLKLHFPESRY